VRRFSLRSKRFRGFGVARKEESGVGEPKRGKRERRRVRKEGRFLPSPPLPSSFVSWLSPHFSRGKNTENPVPRSFLLPNPTETLAT